MSLSSIDEANTEFWDELCASSFAKRIGINDHSRESLAKFDQIYLDMHPYLLKHVDTSKMHGKRVMEVGLGWGTLGQKITEAEAEYIGLDIAEGPVKMMNHRLRMAGLSGRAIRGNMLQCPMEDGSLDYLVSIGCFHHTGNVQRCVDETYRVLKPGGSALIMMYNRFSYWQWIKWPGTTFEALLHDLGLRSDAVQASERQRKSYDSNLSGEAAPETAFLSIKQLHRMFCQFYSVSFTKENCSGASGIIKREHLLPYLGKVAGLDIYIAARK